MDGDETSVGGCSDLLCWQYLRGFCGAAVVCVWSEEPWEFSV